jgi:diguanylate cyclase (GGDEF)-like protein/PAS domain S-box-containing protein
MGRVHIFLTLAGVRLANAVGQPTFATMEQQLAYDVRSLGVTTGTDHQVGSPAAAGPESISSDALKSSLAFLRTSITTLLLGAVVALIAQRIVSPDQIGRSLAPLLVLIIALFSWYLLSRGRVLASKYFLTIGVWSTITAAALFTGGVRAPAAMAYPAIIIGTAWLIHPRAAWFMTALTTAATIGTGLAESWAPLPTWWPSSTVIYVGDQIVIYSLTATLAAFLVRSYRNRVDELSTAITERQKALDTLRIRDDRFRLLFDRATDGIIVLSTGGTIVAANDAFARMHGYTPQEMKSVNLRDLDTPDSLRALPQRFQRILSGEALTFEVDHYHKDGHVVPLEVTSSLIAVGEERLIQAFHRDISQRKLAEEEINHLAFYDPLTNLPNRRLLLDRLTQVIAASARHQAKSALLFVDLDNFKRLNDTKGHLQGDALLKQVAQRLVTCIRKFDTAARLGSDEFAVLLTDLNSSELEGATQAEAVAEKILVTLNQDYELEYGMQYSTSSIGIALFGGNPLENALDILKRGELAMYEAKTAGRNSLRFFDQQMQIDVTRHFALEADLRKAVLNQQFVLFYQAQVVGAKHITGVEVLLRWQHPTRGLVSPLEFIELAEETGLIFPIGQWVLDTACQQLAVWATRPELAHLTLSVNVSARQFHQDEFVEQVLAVLSRTDANPKRLKIELTESMLVQDVEGVITKMSNLKSKGVSFSLDDFGTGYSSLSYLKRLPLDQLKIDQSFVRNILTESKDAAIAKLVVTLANGLGLSVIAEGVELEAQRDELVSLGCHNYQGYLFSRPLPAHEFEALVTRS